MNNLLNQQRRLESRYSLLRVAIILVSFIVAMVTPLAMADPTSISGETAEGVFGEGTKGYGQPDSMTGVMTWTYPFNLPAARGRPQPRLTLSYNSSSRDREAGYGWGLDLPTIERKPLSGNPCFTEEGIPISCGERRRDAFGALISEERYTYNGQPLVFICQLTNSKLDNDQNCGKEPQPKWHSLNGWRYFRLQVEGQFIRFYLSPNRKHWKAQLKGGEVLEFGEPPNSRTPGVEHAAGNKNTIIRWRLVRHSDPVYRLNGEAVNYVDYRWERLGKRGLLYLTDIYDTPRVSNHLSDADFAHHTQLSWESPDFPQTYYADPYRATPDLRLSRVAVASIPWSGTGRREIIRAYFFKYAPAQGPNTTVPLNQVFQLWHHSFLSAIGMHGRCNQFEDDKGRIPEDQKCPEVGHGFSAYGHGFSYYLPPTTFEYEDGFPSMGVASITAVQGGPPRAVDENRVLPYLHSAGVVDFNRDGLPDIVQSWDAEFCPSEGEDENALHQTIRIARNDWEGKFKDTIMCSFVDDDGLRGSDRIILSSRPIIGYLNRGVNFYLHLDHQCMDAGRFDDVTGLTHYNIAATPSFFTNKGATTLLGSWGEGIVAWSKAQYAPFRARPLLPGAKPGEFEPGSGCDAAQFNPATFNPGWEWKKTQTSFDWAKLPPTESPDSVQNFQPRWFVDIDGDGLIDRLASTGIQAGDFEVARPEFTRRYAKNEPLPGGGTGPAQLPFIIDFNKSEAKSLVPSKKGSDRGTKFYYVDINGDGLVDLVTQNPKDNGGIPRVRPGNGYGEFQCIDILQPTWPCTELPTEVAAFYEIEAEGSRKPWPFTDDTFFHDVTADGLADIIQYDKASGEVRLWVNQDGHKFVCPIASCVAGIVQDHRTATRNIGEYRITFADMNADGIDDLVILAKQGAYVGIFMKKYAAAHSFDRGQAPRPGLLIRIHNGYGATTDIRYKTIQELDLQVRETPLAWQYHSPIVESVVTQIVTHGSSNSKQLSAPYEFRRVTQYTYRDPAYDRWSRTLAGFRKVIMRSGESYNEAETVMTYWFGPCQNNSLDALVPGSEDTPLCHEGSDDEVEKSTTGKLIRIDRGKFGFFPFMRGMDGPEVNQRSGGLLWTKTFNYEKPVVLFPSNDRRDRSVTYSYPAQVDIFLYDETQPVTAGTHHTSGTGGDSLDYAPHQKGIRKHLSSLFEYDERGSLKKITEKGSIKDEDSDPTSKPDAIRITLFSSKDTFIPDGPTSIVGTPAPLSCTSDWQCQPDYVSIWEHKPSRLDSNYAELLRKFRFAYNKTTNDLETIEGWLEGPSVSLDRRHPAGNSSTAPQPAGQPNKRGWHTLARFDHDLWGNVILSASGHSSGGSPPNCTAISYDEPYQHLPHAVRRFIDGCSGSALESQTVFERGFAQVVSSTAPNGSSSKLHLDQFGRPTEIYLPDPDAKSVNQAPILAAQIFYRDNNPVSYIDMRQIVGPGKSTRSVTILNGLGESVASFDQGDNDNEWIVRGWKKTNLKGQVVQVRRPWSLFTEDPTIIANSALLIPVPSDNAFFNINYDDFGRMSSIQENYPGFSKELLRYSYFPLAVETRDAEQLKTGGSHKEAFQRIEFDGRGRSVKSIQHIGNPAPEDIITNVKYSPMGEPLAITRTHAGASYQRTMEFDTLGRLMVNREPNTGNNWRYAWDGAGRLVGTSDARGCGVNFYYDGLDRLLGEDYSPCLTSQPAYTAPNLRTGEGLEAFYRYDKYEPDQVSPEQNFADDSKLAIGNLVSVRDRGSYTRFNYDSRGQVRRISRQIAKPEGYSTSSAYTPHWYSSRLDYDLGGRLTRRTTGVDVPELIMNGGSEERYTYSPRGLPFSIDSSYGRIIDSAYFAHDGAPDSIFYGDFYRTVAEFKYDARRQLIHYSLFNSKPHPVYFGPPRSRYITYFDYHFSSYDDVGNPLVIEDKSNGVLNPTPLTKLPPDVAPVSKRSMEYDDLYRLIKIDNIYNVTGGVAPWRSPFEFEINTKDPHPVPLRTLPTRIKQQTFKYDGLGNITASEDDLKARYDRSLGSDLGYGTPLNGPNQLRSGKGLQVKYDEAGNLAQLKIERSGSCPTATGNQCAQWFAYDWDEVGQLARARRWDFDGNSLPPQPSSNDLPDEKPSWDLSYTYSLGARVRKTAMDAKDLARHTLEVFDTLRIEQAPFNATDGNYQVKPDNVHAYLGGMAHAFWDSEDQFPHQTPNSKITMLLNVGDHLGSSTVVINHAKSELVERTTYQPYGAVESNYRPKAFREPYKFTGKEEDIEVGVTYFGARYYQPYLGRFMSADPLTIHGIGSDLNPYAYVAGRVMTYVDPLGLRKCPGCGREVPADEVHVHPPGWSRNHAEDMVNATELGGRRSINMSNTTSEKQPFDPGSNMNWLDRWIWGGTGAFHDTVTSDENLKNVQFAAGAVALGAATIATGGLALEAAGVTTEGLGATVMVNASRTALALTELSLAEHGIVIGGGGAGAILLSKGVAKGASEAEKILYRRGTYDTLKLLQSQAKAAEKSNIGIHGVSVSMNPAAKPGQVVRCATCSAIKAAGFKVHPTGVASDPLHHTVELPKPVTPDVARKWNELFK